MVVSFMKSTTFIYVNICYITVCYSKISVFFVCFCIHIFIFLVTVHSKISFQFVLYSLLLAFMYSRRMRESIKYIIFVSMFWHRDLIKLESVLSTVWLKTALAYNHKFPDMLTLVTLCLDHYKLTAVLLSSVPWHLQEEPGIFKSHHVHSMNITMTKRKRILFKFSHHPIKRSLF